ncbi:MAG: SCO family protein [Steroidobacteraceae bacterium]
MRRRGPALAIALIGSLMHATAARAADAATASTALPPGSIYRLDAALTDQSGRRIGLDAYRGQPVIVTMFYASCPAACPLLIDTIRAVERSLEPKRRAQLRVLMVTVDPVRDTPAALTALAKARRIDPARWTLATSDEATIRKIAALLSIQYRKLPDGEFNHSSVLTVLSRDGEILRRSSVLGRVDPEIVAALP